MTTIPNPSQLRAMARPDAGIPDWCPLPDYPCGVNPSGGVEVDRDNDGELLIDWSPGKGRMLSMTLRADGRLSYAFTWDGEQAHGTAQMPPGVTGFHNDQQEKQG